MKTLIAVVCGISVCLGIATILGENPLNVLRVLSVGSFGSGMSVGYTLFYATPLIFTGLSVAVAFHAGLFNIGAEGQLYMGALALTSLGILWPSGGGVFAPVIGVLAAMAGGALWGWFAGFLKMRRGAHEVIVTIMLNFISYAICGFAIMNLFKNTQTQNPESSEIGQSFFINHLASGDSSPVNSALILAVFTALLVWILLYKTRWGYEVRLAGSSPETARRAGILTERRVMQAMAVSGALAGLVAVNEIMGVSHKFRDQFSPGYGFIGIAVALLARNRPFAILAAALLFGALQKGSLDLELDTEKITRDMSSVMQATIILFVAGEDFMSRVWKSKIVPILNRKRRGRPSLSPKIGGDQT